VYPLKLLLIRHSVTEGNLKRRYIGITDEPLCQAGSEMAERRYSGMPFMPQLVYCSPLLRCIETAGILFPNVRRITVPQLRECDFGIFEGKTHDELAQDPDYIKWVASEGAFTPPNGESGADAQERCMASLENVLSDMRADGVDRAAVVTHGGVIMRIMAQLFGGGIYQWQPENCGGYLLEINGKHFYWKKISGGSEIIADDIAAIL